MNLPKSSSRPRTLWIIAIVLSAIAILLGLWDTFVERDGGSNWMSIAIGASVIALAVSQMRSSSCKKEKG